MPNLFRDVRAIGHDHLAPDLWSGSIDLEMTARTPLVFGEQKCSVVTVPLEDDGKTLRVPPTMVKGMISRAYETLTCSRFRVFGDIPDEVPGQRRRKADTKPLTYRGDAASALGLVPIRITGQEGDQLLAELMYGDIYDYWKYKGDDYPMVRPARLRVANIGQADIPLNELNRLTTHSEKIVFNATLCLHGDKPLTNGKPDKNKYCYWQVTHIQHQGQMREVFHIPRGVAKVSQLESVTGYVCRTASGNDPTKLFASKHDEHVFFDVSEGGPTQVKISAPIQDSYRVVVESYVSNRDNDQHVPNRATAAVQNARRNGGDTFDAASLSAETLAFAVVDETNAGPVVREVVPTMIGRHAYRTSPYRLALEQGVLPASAADEASAADRLFGYVVPDPQPGAAGGDIALRGRISVGHVDTSGANISQARKMLTPLLEPKPSSARRFLTDASGKTPTGRNGTDPLKRSEYFSPGQLLGTAAYPVHRAVLDSREFPKQATRPAVMSGREQHNADVRLTAKSWVKPGSVLRCTVSFTNLNHDELAALIWVLTPENLVPDGGCKPDQNSVQPRCGYLRLGLAKPFGLGVLEVRIADYGLRARRGSELANSYAALSECQGLDEPMVDPEDFKLASLSGLLKMPWVQAMQRAAYGYPKDEVRYMTLKENGENNQTDGATGNPRKNKGVSPRDMFGDNPCDPICIEKPKQNSGRKCPQKSRRDRRR
ncbi:hypothetical protein BW737_006180 [Actinomyces ruminis]|uniref:TIGR03986 family CRISPR-associated RAMP protein n=1 Tax=Actinomyces ruminis TaxID=1937003 RepID=A0ABX4MFQ5_9ACTO|nr:hypothetical protein BW737_006180 [Actinomyces ruminis]